MLWQVPARVGMFAPVYGRAGGRGLAATVVSGVVTGRLMSCLTTDLAKPDAGRLLYVVVGVFCSVSLSGALVCICGKACLGKALCCLPHPLMNAAVKELASLSLSFSLWKRAAVMSPPAPPFR